MHFGHQDNANLPPPDLSPLSNKNKCGESERCSRGDSSSPEPSECGAVVGLSKCTATKVEDGADLDSSPDHCTNNNLLAPESSEQDTCRDACMNIRLRTERLFDYLSAYIAQLATKGTKEAEHELKKVEFEMRTVMQKITHGENLSTTALLLRRELASETREPLFYEAYGKMNNPM
ncbi:hypothetical protein OSTOST_03810 [Ostertagia ostertagi]